MKATTQIFDKIFKRILTLSNVAVINFINGLFDKSFELDSEILYNWTEDIDDNLKKTIADSIITINKTEKFHTEVQINDDETMVFRVFDYGYREALKYKVVLEDLMELNFPSSKIIYLNQKSKVPDKIRLRLNFPTQVGFVYEIPTFKFLDFSLEELDEKNMVILVPLYLLKLREKIKENKTKESALELKNMINNGIIKCILDNQKNENITSDDASVLLLLLDTLYDYLYGEEEFLEEEGVNNMLAEKLIFEYDILSEEKKKLIFDYDILSEKTKKLAFEYDLLVKQVKKQEEQVKKQKEQAELEKEQVKKQKQQAELEKEQAKKQKEQAELEKEQAKKQKEQAELEKEQAKKQKEQAELEKEQAKKQKEQAELEKEQAIIEIAKELIKEGNSFEKISKITKLPIDTIKNFVI